MGLFDSITDMVKTAIGQGLQDRLPSVFTDVLNNTPLSGLKDQLPGLLEQMQNGGLQEQVQSWLQQGANMHVSPDQIISALGPERIQQLAEQMGLPADRVSELLSQYLPHAVDQGARQAEAAGETVQ